MSQKMTIRAMESYYGTLQTQWRLGVENHWDDLWALYFEKAQALAWGPLVDRKWEVIHVELDGISNEEVEDELEEYISNKEIEFPISLQFCNCWCGCDKLVTRGKCEYCRED